MPTYIALYKLTDQGIKNAKEAPRRIEEGIKSAEAMGAKVLGFYAVMGEYDYVGIGEFPSVGEVSRGTGGGFAPCGFREDSISGPPAESLARDASAAGGASTPSGDPPVPERFSPLGPPESKLKSTVSVLTEGAIPRPSPNRSIAAMPWTVREIKMPSVCALTCGFPFAGEPR